MTLSRFRVSERQALHFIMVACVIGFASTFLIVFLRRHTPRADTAQRPIVRWISPRAVSSVKDVRYLVAELEDPSLMSLPDPHAFSGALWRHQLIVPAEPISPPNSLAYLDSVPPRELTALLPSAALAETVRIAADKLVTVPVKPVPAPTVASNHSTLQLDERLESFPLLYAPKLPTIANETPLRWTRVRLAVADDGTILHAMLDRSCGNDRTDAFAIDAAHRLRFALPTEADHCAPLWGTVQFLWATKTP